MLDPRIIMAGRQPDIVGQMGRGAQAAGAINAVGQQNRLTNFNTQFGDQVMAGDQNALARYAQVAGPEAGLNIKSSQQGLQIGEAQLAQIRNNMKLATQKAAAEGDARAVAARAEAAKRVVAMAAAATDPAQAAQILQSNPDTAGFAEMPIGVAIAAVQGADDALKAASERVNPQSARVQSSEILDDGTTVSVLSTGEVRVTTADNQRLEGAAAVAAVEAARQKRAEYERGVYSARREGTNVAEANTGAAAAAAGEAGKTAIGVSEEAYTQAGKISTSIGNIDDAITALDNGGRAGSIDRYLPSVTEASASLQNAMDRMGLDVIGAVTFGALSEGELKLAMETAVPRNLDEPQLKAWLERKRVAQQKTMDMLLDAAVFLGTPGNTLPQWIEKNRGSSGASGSGSQATPSAASEPLDPAEIDRLFEKYGQ